jgi:hypothetical protein
LQGTLPAAESAAEIYRQQLQQKAFLQCPCCEEKLELASGKLIKFHQSAKELTEKERKDISAKLAESNAKIADLKDLIVKAQQELAVTQRDLKDCEGAQTLVQKSEVAKAAQAEGGTNVEQARKALAAAQEALAIETNEDNAKLIDGKIRLTEAVKKVLAPEGIQKTALARALGLFNDKLDKLATKAGWGKAVVHEDLTISFDDFQNYNAENEEFRRRVLLQIAVAQYVKDPLVLIDCADRLQPTHRGSLFTLLKASGLTSVVAMMSDNADAIPDLAEKKAGETRWIVEGVSVPIAQVKKPKLVAVK